MSEPYEDEFPGDSPPASDESIERLEAAYQATLPRDYLEFLRTHDGGSGALGRGFLSLDAVEDVISNREGYPDWPDWIVIGSDGSGVAYVLDKTSDPISFLAVDMITDEDREVVGGSLSDLLEYVRRSEGLSGF